MNETRNIYKALAAVNKSIKPIAKERTNQQQGFKFRGIDDVMNELHSLFAENEIFILQKVNDVQVTERTNTKGTLLFYVRINITYVFTHSDGSYVEITVTGEAMDSGDKATTKAMSIALKYALLQIFLIPTDEEKDPDVSSHEVKPKPKTDPPKPQPEADPFTMTEFDQAIAMIRKADTEAALMDIYNTFAAYRKEKEFMSELSKRKTEIKRLVA
jgi:hypothetical protein